MLGVPQFNPHFSQTTKHDWNENEWNVEVLNNGVECRVDFENRKKSLVYSGRKYETFEKFAFTHPELLDNALNVAKMITHYFGENWFLISDPEAFKKTYKRMYENTEGNRLISSYDHYDTSEIESPKMKEKDLTFIEDQELIFYIEQKSLPYKVVCHLNAKGELEIFQSLLGIIE